jgi:hypothetical protein
MPAGFTDGESVPLADLAFRTAPASRLAAARHTHGLGFHDIVSFTPTRFLRNSARVGDWDRTRLNGLAD